MEPSSVGAKSVIMLDEHHSALAYVVLRLWAQCGWARICPTPGTELIVSRGSNWRHANHAETRAPEGTGEIRAGFSALNLETRSNLLV